MLREALLLAPLMTNRFNKQIQMNNCTRDTLIDAINLLPRTEVVDFIREMHKT